MKDTLPQAQPSSGTALGSAGYPVLPSQVTEAIEASPDFVRATLTLQGALNNGMIGDVSPEQLKSDIEGLSEIDNPPGDAGIQAIIQRVEGAIDVAQSPVGKALPGGTQALGTGFVKFLKDTADPSMPQLQPDGSYKQLTWMDVAV